MKRDTQRKFLVNELWRPDHARGTRLRQGYLSTDSDRLVRVVTEGDQGTLTIKRVTPGGDRIVLDYEIPRGEADLILDSLCLPPLLEKERFREVYAGHVWIIEQFAGDNLGLTLAEIELGSSETPFTQPPWLGEEVTDDPRYFSSNLWRHPFTRWSHGRAGDARRLPASKPVPASRR